jgi:hypothetical protein
MVSISGKRYQARVPDTLDLADRARRAINALTRCVIPEACYAYWQQMDLSHNPPHFRVCDWVAKWIEALPRMRTMCGDELNLDVEQAMRDAFVGQIGQDGLIWYPGSTPPSDLAPDSSSPLNCARLMLAMIAWHDRDGNPEWEQKIRGLARGLDKIAIRRKHRDYSFAYFPLESTWHKSGRWTIGNRPLANQFPYFPPDLPGRDQQGVEGNGKFECGTVVRALVRAYHLCGDEFMIALAEELSAFCRMPSLWESAGDLGVAGHEHGHFAGHFHGNTIAFRGILELALLTGDVQGTEIIREAYDYARSTGIPRLGWYQGWLAPGRHGKLLTEATPCEACAIGNMVALAVILSDAGIGDYWDDVDHYARNQLVEQQICDLEKAERVLEAVRASKPEREVVCNYGIDYDNPLERSMGAFGEAKPTVLTDSGGGISVHGYGCCTGNGSLGLYYAWEGIVRGHDGAATINLLLNRASPWVDIDSYLPYEGRVKVHAKSARSVAVRIPAWVHIDGVRMTLDEQPVRPLRANRYLTLDSLKPGQVIELNFDVPEDSASYLIPGNPVGRHNITFRGSTAITVENELPPDPAEVDTMYQIYERDHLKADRAPLTDVTRYVDDLFGA